MKMNLMFKLVGGFAIVVLITIFVGTTGAFKVKDTVDDVGTIGNIALPSLTQLEIIKIRFLEIKVAVRTLTSPYKTTKDIKEQFKIIEAARDGYIKANEAYNKINTNKTQKMLYGIVEDKLSIATLNNNKLIEMSKGLIETDADKFDICRRLTNEAMSGEARRSLDELLAAIDETINYTNQYYGIELVNNANSKGLKSRITMISTSVIGSFIALILGFIISTSITKPINKISGELFNSAGSLESAAGQVSSSSQELSSGASELASSVEEMTSSLEELQSIIESNSKNVNEGEIMMRETIDGSKLAVEQMVNLNKSHEEIRDNSKKIGKIIKVIDDIAFQTNILALNAAVEAARAGDAGLGFAVVADQVKSLAQKSAEAAKETAELVENNITSVNHGYSLGENVSDSLTKAFDLSSKVEVILEEVNNASKEQLKGANQVTKAISQINTVVQQTASSSEETAAAGEELLSQAEITKWIVGNLNIIIKGNTKNNFVLS